jgi:hypothetical protein
MKNIHMIPTHLPSRLFLNKINNKLLLDSDTYSDLKKILPSSNYQHLYITSDEVIKEGDWYIDDANQIRKSITSDKQYWAVRQDYKKIILTTDKKLITDGVQSIDDEFLQWFIKNPSCEEVKVEKEKVILGEVVGTTYIDYNYKIIIPQEEDKPKSTTKEELGRLAFDRFIAGSKSDTARDYWFTKFKQETTLEQIDQTNPITKGSTALVYKQDALDLDKLESKLDAALNSETTESLTQWIETKRNNIPSVEWLIETLSNKHIGFEMYFNSNKEIIEQANAMNQQEIVTAYQEGTKDNFNSPNFGSGLNYFRETYKK